MGQKENKQEVAKSKNDFEGITMSREMELIKRFCNTVWEYDASVNQIYIHRSHREPENGEVWRPYEEYYLRYRDIYIRKEDADIWEHYMLPEHLKDFLKGERSDEHFLLRTKLKHFEYEWYEIYLEKLDANRLLIVSRNINEVQRNAAITQAAMMEVDYVCRINIETKNYIFYYSGDPRGTIPQYESNDYFEMITKFNKTIVVPEEYETFCQQMNLEQVIKKLQDQEEYILYATMRNEGKLTYKKFRFCYADSRKKELLLSRIDVTKEKFLTNELQRSQEKMRHILETTTALVFQYYPEDRGILLKDLGLRENKNVLQEEDLLQQLLGKGYLEESCEKAVVEAFKQIRDGEASVSITIRARRSIDLPWVWCRMVMFDYQDLHTQERRVLGYLQNIDHEIVMQEQLMQMAQIDHLTGIFNVGAGKRKVQDVLAQQGDASRQYNAMFILDLDNFKKVNDTLGHMQGDDVLRRFAGVMRETFRTGDIVYRLGGDEFAAFVSGMQDYKVAINSIMARFTRRLAEARAEYPFISISVGIFVSNTVKDYQRYYQEADWALYETKRNGKNHYAIRISAKEENYFFHSDQPFDSDIQTKTFPDTLDK